ncbi:unnamed protein product [marine sediment metagenome]|uniref:Uncharacterized protein n=1 Tax=marine sediment metagenome TaxID=412755 RepID=X1HA50_9ZZZZ
MSLMKKHEEHMRQAERFRFMYHPHVMEITANLKRKYGVEGLICPACGGSDNGNTMNGKPWCMKCNIPLMTEEKAADWVKPVKPKKPGGYTFIEPDDIMKKR